MKAGNQRAIESVVRSMGLVGNSLAVRQLVCAVELAHEDRTLLYSVTKGLYPAVAAHFEGANGLSVERNLRSARDNQWARGDQERLREMAGFSIRLKPSTGEFVDMICYYMESHGLLPDG